VIAAALETKRTASVLSPGREQTNGHGWHRKPNITLPLAAQSALRRGSARAAHSVFAALGRSLEARVEIAEATGGKSYAVRAYRLRATVQRRTSESGNGCAV
jgi:hypothetical protein